MEIFVPVTGWLGRKVGEVHEAIDMGRIALRLEPIRRDLLARYSVKKANGEFADRPKLAEGLDGWILALQDARRPPRDRRNRTWLKEQSIYFTLGYLQTELVILGIATAIREGGDPWAVGPRPKQLHKAALNYLSFIQKSVRGNQGQRDLDSLLQFHEGACRSLAADDMALRPAVEVQYFRWTAAHPDTMPTKTEFHTNWARVLDSPLPESVVDQLTSLRAERSTGTQ